MEVIALQGGNKTGKTTTINVLYQLLLFSGWVQVPGKFRNLDHNDFLDILTDGHRKLGIVSQGDFAARVIGYLSNFLTEGCFKAVCACTVPKPRLVAAISRYTPPPPTFVSKTPATGLANIRTTNNTDAQSLIRLI